MNTNFRKIKQVYWDGSNVFIESDNFMYRVEVLFNDLIFGRHYDLIEIINGVESSLCRILDSYELLNLFSVGGSSSYAKIWESLKW